MEILVKGRNREQFLFFISFFWFFCLNPVILTNMLKKKKKPRIKKTFWSTGLDLHFINQTGHSHLSYRQGKDYLASRNAIPSDPGNNSWSRPLPCLPHTDTSSSESAGTHRVTNYFLRAQKPRRNYQKEPLLGLLSSEGMPPPLPITALQKDNDLYFLLHLKPPHFLKQKQGGHLD